MMIELYGFLNHKDDSDFEVLLESFSRRYCRSGVIYVEGIEFRANIDNTHEGNEKSKDVQQITRSNSNTGMLPFSAENDEIFDVTKNSDVLSEMNGKKHHMVSVKEALYDSSNVKLFKLRPSHQSRFGVVIEVQSQQVFCINCKIESQLLSPDTDYRCYLVFKVSEKCCGLHCPVKVQGVHHPVKVESHKETKALYLRSPINAWNIHDIDQVPKQRKDGSMEVNVWKFHSMN
ncbi:F-box protein PP2-B10-like [Bidens hawaiensis]|uniref:F-box protein PP2-B10-like n=1 Tax=Bidens hawaiensis TaxID=980011 RepID=UPI00404A14C0